MSETSFMNLSPASVVFDRVAASYDSLFTYTLVGYAQRKQVWKKLLEAFAPGDRILELNCGTGEDARFLARRGMRIVACDASATMIEVANVRTQREAREASITFRHLANEDLGQLLVERTFDGIFSNFSGLNCTADLHLVAQEMASLVRPGGRVLLCFWSRFCLWEVCWFLSRAKIGKAFRRWSAKTTAGVGGLRTTVFYPTVGELRSTFAPWFTLEKHRAIGLFVPPSYVEGLARKRQWTLERLERLDELFADLPVFRNIGDHVLLEFTRCSR